MYIWIPSREEVVRIRTTLSDLLSVRSPESLFTSALKHADVDYRTFDSKREAMAWLSGLGITDGVTWKEFRG